MVEKNGYPDIAGATPAIPAVIPDNERMPAAVLDDSVSLPDAPPPTHEMQGPSFETAIRRKVGLTGLKGVFASVKIWFRDHAG